MKSSYSVFWIVLGVLVFASCASKRTNSSSNSSGKEESDSNIKSVVWINLTTTASYCGGAAPTDEIIQDLQTPKKLTQTTIYIREGETNSWSQPIIAKGISDENGVVSVELKDGTYCVVFENKAEKSAYDNLIKLYGEKTPYRDAVDVECLKTFMEQPEAVFTVKNGKTESAVIINQHQPCSWHSVPCSGYHGPLPPMAAPRVNPEDHE